MRTRSLVVASAVSFTAAVGGLGPLPRPAAGAVLPTTWTLSRAGNDVAGMSGNGRFLIHEVAQERSLILDRTTGRLTSVKGLVSDLGQDARLVTSRLTANGPLYVVDRVTKQGWRVVNVPTGSRLGPHIMSANGNVIAAQTYSQTTGAQSLTLGRRGGLQRTIRTAGGGLLAYTEVRPLQLSADGRYLLYAARCVTGCKPNGRGELRVFDALNATTRVVSRSTAGVESNADESIGAISPDGRYVIWPSTATSLAPGTTTSTMRVYVRDLRADTTRVLPYSSVAQFGYERGIAISNSGLAVYQGWRRSEGDEYATVVAYDMGTRRSVNLGIDAGGNAIDASISLGTITPDAQHGVMHAGASTDQLHPGAPAVFFDLGTSGRAFTPASPWRVLDTRAAIGVATRTRLRANTELVVRVTSPDGTPIASTIAAINLVAVRPVSNGFVSAYPCATGPTPTSSVNAARGATIANLVRIGLNTDGEFCVRASTAMHLVADLVVLPELDFLPGAAAVRVLDTRRPLASPSMFAADEVRKVAVNGVSGVIKGHTPMALNVTVTGAAAAGAVTVSPCGATTNEATSMTFRAKQTKASFAVGYPDVDGFVCVHATTATHVIIDAQHGTLDPDDFFAASTVLDTTSVTVEALSAGQVRTLDLDPDDTSSSPIYLFLRLAATNVAGAGTIKVHACGQPSPSTDAMVLTGSGGAERMLTYALTSASGELCVLSSVDTDLVIERGFVNDVAIRPVVAPSRVLAPVRVLGGRTIRLGTFSPEALLSIKATNVAGNGYLTVHLCGEDRLRNSSLNYVSGDTASNVVAAYGEMCVFTSATATIAADLIAEITGIE